MSRSLKKGPYIDPRLQEKIDKQVQAGTRNPIKTWARASQISPTMVGFKMSIYNGKKFIDVLITEGMVGHRLGEFSPTRTFRGHGKVTKRTADKT